MLYNLLMKDPYSFFYKEVKSFDEAVEAITPPDYYTTKYNGIVSTSRRRLIQMLQIIDTGLVKYNGAERQKIIFTAANLVRKTKTRFQQGGKDYLMYLADKLIQHDDEYIDIEKRSSWINEIMFKHSSSVLKFKDETFLRLMKIDPIDAIEHRIAGLKKYYNKERILEELEDLEDVHAITDPDLKNEYIKQHYPECYKIIENPESAYASKTTYQRRDARGVYS